MLVIILILLLLGLCLGSFVDALVWRFHKKKDFLRARSQCVNCGHKLAGKDLIPIFSWLWLRGRCRYCRKPISVQYPLVELTMAAVFVLSYALWPQYLAGGQWLLFITWLLVSVGLLALAVYDIRWMLLPNKILYPTFFVALAGRLAYILFYSEDIAHNLWLLALSILVTSGLFGLIYVASAGRAIGFGDVRLGLISGTVLADPLQGLLMIFVASVLGTLFVLPALVKGQKNFTSKVPYGPFLILATFIVLIFGPSIIDWYNQTLLNY